jgi:drug/metabolite transporter (DMT)-like permease
MRLRISLFELLLLITPAFAITLGLLMAAINSGDPSLVLTIAQSVYLVAMLIAVCTFFDRRPAVRVFAGAFLAASLGHLLLVWFSNQSAYSGSFPTTAALQAVFAQAHPEVAANGGQTVYSGLNNIWTSYPVWTGSPGGYSGFGYSGGLPGMPGGPLVPLTTPTMTRPIFVEVGIWACSLLLGVLCGVVAKSLHGRRSGEEQEVSSATNGHAKETTHS